MSDGYGKGVGEYEEEPIHPGKIAVGVEAEGEDSDARLAGANHVLAQAGATFPTLICSTP
jgi:hypothetical protein